MAKNRIAALYQELKRQYNARGQWQLWCKSRKTIADREEIIIAAILAQNTNWQNVEKAMANLKKTGVCRLSELANIKTAQLEKLIRPSGFFRAKASYLQSAARFFIMNAGVAKVKSRSLKRLREELLALRGVGPETADSILNYALDKPVFVIDEYTRRLARRKQLARNFPYDYLQRLFEKNLKKNYRLYQNLHALIVIDGKEN